MFHFAKNLFMTDKIRPDINRIKFKLYSGIGMFSICLITFSPNDSDIFEIYPVEYFKQKNLRKRDFYIAGVAENKSAAMEMTSELIVGALANKGDSLSVRDYLVNQLKW